eukprot:4860054-Amphidinium_carterae.1
MRLLLRKVGSANADHQAHMPHESPGKTCLEHPVLLVQGRNSVRFACHIRPSQGAKMCNNANYTHAHTRRVVASWSSACDGAIMRILLH